MNNLGRQDERSRPQIREKKYNYTVAALADHNKLKRSLTKHLVLKKLPNWAHLFRLSAQRSEISVYNEF